MLDVLGLQRGQPEAEAPGEALHGSAEAGAAAPAAGGGCEFVSHVFEEEAIQLLHDFYARDNPRTEGMHARTCAAIPPAALTAGPPDPGPV